MGEERVVPLSTFRLCIDTWQEGRMAGKIYIPSFSGTIPFADLVEIFARLDGMMNGGGFPQAFMRLRGFQARPETIAMVSEDGEEPSPMGTLATISVRIQTRLQADWQGTLIFDDGRMQGFRGILELLRLVTGELSGTNVHEAE